MSARDRRRSCGIVVGLHAAERVDNGLTALDDWFLVIPFLPLAIVLVSLLGARADTWPGGKISGS